MRNEPVKTIEVGNKVVEIYPDIDPESPRGDCNLGKMVCWHSRYTLGDKHDYESPQDFQAEWDASKAVILPLYLYDHGGLTISTGAFSCPWDSGQVGYVYVSHEDIAKEYGKCNAFTIEKARKLLIAEVETYDAYLRGDIYGYVVKVKCEKCGGFEETEDSCWGYYGIEEAIKAGMEVAK